MKRGDYALLHKETIGRGEDFKEPYLTRWRLIQCPLFAVYLHRFTRPDLDEDMHDHPWDFISVILWGGYIEQSPTTLCDTRGCKTICVSERKQNEYGFGSVIRHKATDLHQIYALHNVPTWTLVFCGPRKREWGFKTKNGWVNWRKYLGLDKET